MLRCHFTPFRKHVFSILPAKGVMEVLFSMGENGDDNAVQGPGCVDAALSGHTA